MRWLFRRKPKSRAYIHFIEAGHDKRGRRVGARWHVDICDIETGKLLFVCPPHGYTRIGDAREAVAMLGGRVDVELGHRPKRHT